MRNKFLVLWLWLTVVSVAMAGVDKVETKTVAFESLTGHITADLFDPDFLYGDNAYTAMISASDGKVYFFIGSHHKDYACRFYSFDPTAGKITLISKMDAVVGEDEKEQYSQNKVHTRIYEHGQKLWFARIPPSIRKMLPG